MEQKIAKIFTTQDNIQAEMIINTLKENDVSVVKEDLGNAGIMNLYGGILNQEKIFMFRWLRENQSCRFLLKWKIFTD